jgi:1-acyl-sn-glycerol-3-phosphate acyltransferase
MDSGDLVRTRGRQRLTNVSTPFERSREATTRQLPLVPLRLLRRLIHTVLFYVLLLHLGAMSLTWNLVCLVLYPFLPRRQGVIVGRAAISSVYRGFWRCACWMGLMRVDFTALDVLDRDAGLIIASNHPNIMDALLVISRVPRGICIMRSSLMRNPFLGAGARLARYIRNDPPRGMIRSCVANLKDGGQLVLFPEGTRTITPPINPFRPGLTLIALMAQVPIQTVIIETDSPYLGKGWPIWRLPEFPVAIHARLGQRFEPEADHQGLLKRIEAYFAGELRA